MYQPNLLIYMFLPNYKGFRCFITKRICCHVHNPSKYSIYYFSYYEYQLQFIKDIANKYNMFYKPIKPE